MSRGHQSRRRRSYGRRQHEVRERNGGRGARPWLPDEMESGGHFNMPAGDERRPDPGRGAAQG